LLTVLSPAEFLYWQLALSGRAEPELEIFPQWVRRDTLAVDVGANVGLYSLAFLRRGANVMAIEPLTRYTDALDALSKRFPKLKICHAAASDAAGQARLSVPVGDIDLGGYATLRPLSGRHQVQTVRTVRLDDLDLDNVSAIKIDVEGHETFVINGARNLIRTFHPFLMIELEQRYISEPVEDAIKMIEDLGYKGFYLKSGSLCPATHFSVETHQRPNYLPYINNFIFKPLTPGGAVEDAYSELC
jgi:FkbM family methyltransferase